MSNNRYEFSTMTNVDAKDKAAKELLDYVSGNTAAIFSGFDRSDVQYQSDRLVKDRNAKELQKKLEEEEVTKFLMSSRRSEKPAATMQVAMKEKRKGDELMYLRIMGFLIDEKRPGKADFSITLLSVISP